MKSNEKNEEFYITKTFYSRFVKRFFDIFLSLLAIIILSPILLLTFLLTLIFIGAPTIYKQVRPGKNHKTFCIYKFRSMTNKKDKDGNLLPDEQRITWFGKFLRKTSLDELPQLFNILKGDMSIVGPRPRLVRDMVFYDKVPYDYYAVKPGLTGPTQAFGRNKNTWEQVFEKDIHYARHITFGYDIKIIFFTFFSVFKNQGETHSNMEENKKENSKEQEYYYADYLLRTQKITKEQYDNGMAIAEDLVKSRGKIEYYPELHNIAENENESQNNIVSNEEKEENQVSSNEVQTQNSEPQENQEAKESLDQTPAENASESNNTDNN